MSMYLRLKRRNQTLFLHVEPSDSFASIKQRVGEVLDVEPTSIMLLNTDKVATCLCRLCLCVGIASQWAD